MKFIDNKGIEHETYLTMLRIDTKDKFNKIFNTVKDKLPDPKPKEDNKQTNMDPVIVMTPVQVVDVPVETGPIGDDCEVTNIFDEGDDEDPLQPSEDKGPPGQLKYTVSPPTVVDEDSDIWHDIMTHKYSKINIDYGEGTITLYNMNGEIVSSNQLSEELMQRIRYPEAYQIDGLDHVPDMPNNIKSIIDIINKNHSL